MEVVQMENGLGAYYASQRDRTKIHRDNENFTRLMHREVRFIHLLQEKTNVQFLEFILYDFLCMVCEYIIEMSVHFFYCMHAIF